MRLKEVKLNKQLAVMAIWSVALIYLRMGGIPHAVAVGCSAYNI